MRFHKQAYGELACFLHDPLAVGAVLWPDLLRSVARRVDVEVAGRHTRGMTVADFRPDGYRSKTPPNGEVCLEVDADAFVDRFLARLAQPTGFSPRRRGDSERTRG
jgi:purine nucleosidase